MDVTALAQFVPFVHPAIATAAVATGLIPLVIHLIHRRRYRRIPWAAMLFLKSAQQRSAKRIWMERWLLLLVRVLLVVLFGLAVARPYLPASAAGGFAASRAHHVLLLDNSLSMNSRVDDTSTRFELARAYARRWLESLPPKDAVSLITLASPAEAVIDFPAYDRRLVRERLSAVVPTQRTTDIEGACAAVSRILNDSDVLAENHTVSIVSDLAKGSWVERSGRDASGGALARLVARFSDSRNHLTIARVGPTTSDNMAVTDLTFKAPLLGTMIPLTLTATATNYASRTARQVTIEFRRGDEIIRRQSLPAIQPGESKTVSVSTTLPLPGTHAIVARLTGNDDVLRADDARFLSIEVKKHHPLLLVDGFAGASLLDRESGFLAIALAPQLLQRSGTFQRGGDRLAGPPTLVQPKVVAAPDLPDEALADYDIVALCNVARLTRETWAALERFISGGGGLMVFAGDSLDGDNYNRWGYRNGTGILPGRWAAAPTTPRVATGFSADELMHPIVRPFHGFATSGLFAARVNQYWPIDLDADRAQIVLRYKDGAAAMVASSFGLGRVLTYTTTASMRWNNLPAKGDYVSLMISAFAYLTPTHGAQRNLTVGGTIRARLRPEETSLPLRMAEGQKAEVAARLAPLGDGLALEYGPLERAGVYTALIGAEARRFVANVDPTESDVAGMDEAAFRSTMGVACRFINDASSPLATPAMARAGELSAMMLYLVAGLLTAELWMSWWLGSRRSGR